MWIDRRILMVAGAASIALNVFLFGIVFGHAIFGNGRAKHAAQAGPIIAAGKIKALSQDERRSFNKAMATHRPQIRTARETQRAARAAVLHDIAAQTYDAEKVRGDFASLRQAHEAVRGAIDDALTDALGQLPADARASLVERMP